MAGLLVGAGHLVERFAQARAEQLRPRAVDNGPAEVRVVLRDGPVAQYLARLHPLLDDRLFAVEELRLHLLVGVGDLDLVGILLIALYLGEVALPGALDTAEEGGEAPELLTLPVSEGMIVALSAGEVDAKGDPRHRPGDLLRRVILGGVERHRAAACPAEDYRRLAPAPAGDRLRDQLLEHHVDALARLQPGDQPALEG